MVGGKRRDAVASRTCCVVTNRRGPELRDTQAALRARRMARRTSGPGTLRDQGRAMQIEDVISRPLRSVTAATSVAEARKLLRSLGLLQLPVVDASGVIVGIVDDARGGSDVNQSVGAVMVKDPPFIDFDDDVEEAAALMAEHQLDELPVVGPRAELVGFVSRTDVARALTEPAHSATRNASVRSRAIDVRWPRHDRFVLPAEHSRTRAAI